MTGSQLVRFEEFGVIYPGPAAIAPALAGVTLALGAGERLGIIGESGSGKSTLALALAGLLPSDAHLSGRIDWATGRLLPGRDIGFVFQDPGGSFNPVLTVGEQIAEVAVTHLGLSWRQARRRAVELVDRVKLPDPERLVGVYPHQLSGGQRQRAAIAVAIAAGPKLLIADEATSALDTVVQAEIVALVDGLVRETAMSLLFITHDIALAAGLADRIAVFQGGRMLEQGDARTVVTRPHHAYTRSLLAAHLHLDDTMPGDMA